MNHFPKTVSRPSDSTRSNLLLWSLVAALVAAMLVFVRVLPIGGPAIFSDEYAYAAWASALLKGLAAPPPYAAAVGNWLYLRLYGLTFVGSGSFLVNARIINAVITGVSAGVLVFTFRLVEPGQKLVLVAGLAVSFAAGLLGTYAAYFIPEAPYYASVCFWLYCAAKYAGRPKLSLALAIGIAGGIATMTKAHGIFMLPASLLVLLLIGVRLHRGWRDTSSAILALVVGWFVCTTVISVWLGAHAGINPIGSFYAGLGVHTAEYVGGDRGWMIIRVGLRHLATLVFIGGMPLLLCGWLSLVALFCPSRSTYDTPLRFTALLLFILLVGMLFVTAVFTVSVAGMGPYETVNRLHGRYYEHFALLACCVGILGSGQIIGRWSGRARALMFGVFLALLGLSWWLLRNVGWQNPNDFAMAYALFALPNGRWYAVGIGLLGAGAALLWPKRAPVFFSCAFAIWLGVDSIATERLRWPVQEPAAGRVAAMVAANEAGSSRATIEIVGSGATVPVLRAAFHLLNERIGFALGGASNSCDVGGSVPDWVITVEGAHDPCGYPDDIRIGDSAAAQRNAPSTVARTTKHVVSYHARMALLSPPVVMPGNKDIRIATSVTNDGTTTFGSATTPHNVNLGAHTIDASGKIVDNDLARGHLLQISPGATEKAVILLPIDRTLGHRVELLPVEEDVAWFDKWGTEPLVLGPFESCASAPRKVCDAEGKPLPTSSSQ